MSYAEYCAFERESAIKHEYLRGEVFAMAGGTLEHARLATWVSHVLLLALDGRACEVMSADARVHIEATELDTYPDVSVVCGERRTAAEDDHALLNPILLVEVLSDSTEAYDRGQKASHYRQIPSLQAYLLVSQYERRLELQVRQADGVWSLIEARPGEQLTIAPLGITLSVDEVYRNSTAG